MDVDYIALAVPLFFLGIGIELWLARRRRARVYRFGDALIDLGTGMTQQATLLFGNVVLLAGYVWVWRRWHLFDFEGHALAAWTIAFFGVDFIYYWWHRLSHEVNFLWAAHVVHHSSEDYNLAVALRQSILTEWTNWPFFALLAVVGVPPIVYATTHAFNTLYQFWIHTQLVGRLGKFEHVFNTPSQHRVHHAINPRYLDKNYGGTLMVWDRLFGTFEPETEAPVYGLVKPLHSYNPVWAQVHYLVDLVRYTLKTPFLVDKIKVWLKGPTWAPRGVGPWPPPPEVTPSTFRKYDPEVPRRVRPYLLLQLAVAVVALTWAMLRRPMLSPSVLTAVLVLIVWTLLAIGALLERKRWAIPVEAARLAALAAAIVAF
jgi:sterol desaturase/sphingolipid hydroxylase (fatty acid hydroxylase superfamily)